MVIRVEMLNFIVPRCSNILDTGSWANVQYLVVIFPRWHNIYLQDKPALELH